MMRLIGMALLLTAAQGVSAQTATPQPTDPHRPAPVTDTVAPKVPADIRKGVLIISKTSSYRHLEHIPHSNAVLSGIAKELGHQSFMTENAAVFDDALLKQFSVVVLNSTNGMFLTPDQGAALERFVAGGGGLIALHAAGDSSYKNGWYDSTVMGGTRFIGHTSPPVHFQNARVVPSSPRHPIMKGVTLPWSPRDEWYSFSADVAQAGMTVLASLDEASYTPGKVAMGAKHPVIWINPKSKGRVFYSALGHDPESYDDPNYRRILTNAIRWAAKP